MPPVGVALTDKITWPCKPDDPYSEQIIGVRNVSIDIQLKDEVLANDPILASLREHPERFLRGLLNPNAKHNNKSVPPQVLYDIYTKVFNGDLSEEVS
jgi:hypothetical protein